jgi:hypothetical protein
VPQRGRSGHEPIEPVTVQAAVGVCERPQGAPASGLAFHAKPQHLEFFQAAQRRPAEQPAVQLEPGHLLGSPGGDRSPDSHGLPLAMDVVLRAVIIYVVVFGFTRVLGRRELSSLQPFDLILLIVIGDLIQSGVTQNDLSVTASAGCARSCRASRSCWSKTASSSSATCAANGSPSTTWRRKPG